MTFLIGDTVRFEAVIKNFEGIEQAPAEIKLAIYKSDGTTELLSPTAATLKTGKVAEYYYDWTIAATLAEAQTLIAVWTWSGPHKKKVTFDVEPVANI